MEIVQNGTLQDVGMNLGDTVDRMAADNGQVCHTDLAVP